MPKRTIVGMQYAKTSTMAVNTDSPAFEPDFRVPNPTARMVWPLNKVKYSACWSCTVTIAWAILCFLSRFLVWFLDLVVEIHVTCLYKAPWITACKTRSKLLELACPSVGQVFDMFAYHFFFFLVCRVAKIQNNVVKHEILCECDVQECNIVSVWSFQLV